MNKLHKSLLAGAMAVTTLGGGVLGAGFLTGTANAQTDATSTADTSTADATTDTTVATPAVDDATATSSDSATPLPARDPSQGGHQANGITEELLTGDTASQVTAAAQAAVPDGTIERVENDAEGAAYEAHVVKADGSHVTVKLDASFNVTSIEDGAR